MQCWAFWHENSGDLLLPAAIHELEHLRAASLPLAQAEPSWELAGSCCRVRARPVSPLQPQDEDWKLAQQGSTWLAGVLRAVL